jgi:hypothetical protein
VVARGEEVGEYWPPPVGAAVRQGGSLSTSVITRTTPSPLRSLAGKAYPVLPPSRRSFTAATGARRILTAKWFVSGGLEVPNGGGASPEGGF